ncbi:MAG TPA: hypothetical protein VLZ74_15805 [Methylocella sp.]|nr:hypothetical protein [Methylocella sp.]
MAEAHIGPSHVDEYLSLDAVCFLLSCMSSYSSIRKNNYEKGTSNRLERLADYFFMFGLIAMTFISVLFAYEFI